MAKPDHLNQRLWLCMQVSNRTRDRCSRYADLPDDLFRLRGRRSAALFNLEVSGHIYSRISNPTVAVLEERIAALEGGVGTLCTAADRLPAYGDCDLDGGGRTYCSLFVALRRHNQYVPIHAAATVLLRLWLTA